MAHVADSMARVVRLAVTEDCDLTGGRAQQAGKDSEQCRFSSAVFSQKYVALTGSQLGCHLTQGGERAEEPRNGVQAGYGRRAIQSRYAGAVKVA